MGGGLGGGVCVGCVCMHAECAPLSLPLSNPAPPPNPPSLALSPLLFCMFCLCRPLDLYLVFEKRFACGAHVSLSVCVCARAVGGGLAGLMGYLISRRGALKLIRSVSVSMCTSVVCVYVYMPTV